MGRRDPRRSSRRNLGAVDLVDQAAAGLVHRPRRTALAGASIAVGVAVVVAVMQMAAGARAQLAVLLDRIETTVVEVTDAGVDGHVIPADDTRLRRVPGVTAAGWFARTGAPLSGPADAAEVSVIAVSPGVFDAVDAVVTRGRPLVEGDAGRAVAVVGAAAADRLGIRSLSAGVVVEIGGHEFTLVGRLGSVRLHPELLDAFLVPAGTATTVFPALEESLATVVLRTLPGTADAVASRAALALAPQAPGQLAVRVDPAPVRLRRAFEDQYRSTLLLLGAAVVAVGALGVGLVTSAAVDERRQEIAVRRSLGATRADIRDQFVLEAVLLGLVAAAAGVGFGMTAAVAAVVGRGWPWRLGAPWGLAAVAGVAVLLAGVAAWLPARSAARRAPGIRST
ncbi:MAG: ABC transporter permease [Actinomyces sp.]|nr:MAG: ABC transporter permease [Actinomyces sp.]